MRNAASFSSGENMAGAVTAITNPSDYKAGLLKIGAYRIAAALYTSPGVRSLITSPFFRRDSKGLVAFLTGNTLLSNELVSRMGDNPVALKDLSNALFAMEGISPEKRLLDELSEPEQDTQPQPQTEPAQQ